MRELLVRVPEKYGDAVFSAAEECGGMNLARLQVKAAQPTELVIGYIPNSKIDVLMEHLREIPELYLTLKPRGSIPLSPPSSKVSGKVTRVEPRSSIEIFFAGLQSVGSWKSFLSYTVAGGIVAWIGLFTNTIYLLVAAMLIAPFAGPAMNLSMATACGDSALLKSSLIRYFASIGLAVAVALGLSLVLAQNIATPLMVEISQVSIVSVLLPIVAGAAGALNLVQSERNSLVSGAAVGMLVASSLSPPTAMTGMALSIGRWDLAGSGLFVLLLQLIGINLSGSLVFRLYGLKAKRTWFDRGKSRVTAVSLLLTACFLFALLFFQFTTTPSLERSSLSQRASAEIQQVIEESGIADMVEANVRFARPNIQSQNTLLCVVYLQRKPAVNLSTGEIEARITESIQKRLLQKDLNATPLVSVTVLTKPEDLPGRGGD